MADLQSWRRHTSRTIDNTHIYHGQIDDIAPSDDTSCSTSSGMDDSKLRPRPRRSLASFASYLGTHHRILSPTCKSEWPSIDWSNLNSLNDKDGVYKPDTELMCTTITQQVLANPSADLPAQYNTFVLHLIEAYYQSKADVQDLHRKLVEEIECNQTTRDEFQRAFSSSPLKKAHMLRSLENADSNTLHSTGPGNEAITARLQRHNFTDQTSKSSNDYEGSGQKQKEVDKTGTSERHRLMSSAHKYRGPITAAIGVESSRDHWPPSPLQYGTELIECDASSADSEGEVSGLEDNIASRLAGWLALRLKCQPGDISVELSELLRSTQKGLSKDLAPRNIGSLGPTMPTASGEVVLPGKTRLLPGPSNKLIGTSGSLSFQSIRALGHRRGFSFLPGDDSANPISSNSFGGRDPGSEISLIRPLAWQDTKQKERGGSGESAKGELSGGWAVGLRSQQELIKSDVPSTARSDVSKNLQRDGSGKSILTTIISSSSRSSSLSHRGSLNNVAGTDGLREGSIRSGNSHLAIAAARAAKIGTVNGRAFQRQSSS